MGDIVSIPPVTWGIVLSVPANADPAIKEAIEKASLRMVQCRELLIHTGDVAGLVKLQKEVADIVLAKLNPIHDWLVMGGPLDAVG
jgi:hypothetical protein